MAAFISNFPSISQDSKSGTLSIFDLKIPYKVFQANKKRQNKVIQLKLNYF